MVKILPFFTLFENDLKNQKTIVGCSTSLALSPSEILVTEQNNGVHIYETFGKKRTWSQTVNPSLTLTDRGILTQKNVLYWAQDNVLFWTPKNTHNYEEIVFKHEIASIHTDNLLKGLALIIFKNGLLAVYDQEVFISQSTHVFESPIVVSQSQIVTYHDILYALILTERPYSLLIFALSELKQNISKNNNNSNNSNNNDKAFFIEMRKKINLNSGLKETISAWSFEKSRQNFSILWKETQTWEIFELKLEKKEKNLQLLSNLQIVTFCKEKPIKSLALNADVICFVGHDRNQPKNLTLTIWNTKFLTLELSHTFEEDFSHDEITGFLESTDHTYLIISLSHNIVFCQFSEKVKVSIASALGKIAPTKKFVSSRKKFLGSENYFAGPALNLKNYFVQENKKINQFVAVEFDKTKFSDDVEKMEKMEEQYLEQLKKIKNEEELEEILQNFKNPSLHFLSEVTSHCVRHNFWTTISSLIKNGKIHSSTSFELPEKILKEKNIKLLKIALNQRSFGLNENHLLQIIEYLTNPECDFDPNPLFDKILKVPISEEIMKKNLKNLSIDQIIILLKYLNNCSSRIEGLVDHSSEPNAKKRILVSDFVLWFELVTDSNLSKIITSEESWSEISKLQKNLLELKRTASYFPTMYRWLSSTKDLFVSVPEDYEIQVINF